VGYKPCKGGTDCFAHSGLYDYAASIPRACALGFVAPRFQRSIIDANILVRQRVCLSSTKRRRMNCRLEILRAEAQRPGSLLEMKVNANLFLITAVTIGAFIACTCCSSKTQSSQEPEPVEKSVPVIQTQDDDRPIIVAFGDSLTAGRGVDPDQNYPSKLQAKIDRAGYRYRVLNAGVSGETSSQGLNRVETYLNPPPVIAIVELGANDGLRGLPLATIRKNLDTIVELFRTAGTKVILAGMEVPPNYGPQYADSFREMFQSVAKDNNAYLIPFFLDGVGGYPELNQDDGIHPTAEGYDIVVENVWKVLEPLL